MHFRRQKNKNHSFNYSKIVKPEMKLVDSGHSQYAYQALNFPSTTQIENKLQFNK